MGQRRPIRERRGEEQEAATAARQPTFLGDKLGGDAHLEGPEDGGVVTGDDVIGAAWVGRRELIGLQDGGGEGGGGRGGGAYHRSCRRCASQGETSTRSCRTRRERWSSSGRGEEEDEEDEDEDDEGEEDEEEAEEEEEEDEERTPVAFCFCQTYVSLEPRS